MMSRILELRDLQTAPSSQDCYFRNFEASLETNPQKRKRLIALERDLQGLDHESWVSLRGKAAPHFTKPATQRGWQQAFDRLNEARAYRALVRGGWRVAFIAENGSEKRPDLRATSNRRLLLCEAKTVHVSAKQALETYGGLTLKLSRTIAGAGAQIAAHPDAGAAEKLVYLVVEIDARAGDVVEAIGLRIEAFVDAHSTGGLRIEFDMKTVDP